MNTLRQPNNNSPLRVLIVSSDTGGGHSSAARALQVGLSEYLAPAPVVHVARVLEESSHLLHSACDLYNYLLRNHQDWVKYYHAAINKLSLHEAGFLYRQFRKYGQHLLERFLPNVIISVHPMLQHGIARLLEEIGLLGRIPFITVVTDPCGGKWKGWADPRVDLYLVAHDSCVEDLAANGVPREKIKVVGMPVRPEFRPVEPETAAALRSQLGLEKDRFTVLLNSGWAGGGNTQKIFRNLIDSDLDIQAIFVAGRDQSLKKQADHLSSKARFPVRVLGFTERMDQILSAAHVMVSKLGGLTTFEALACRVPIIVDAVTQPMPQEERTIHLIESRHVGLLLHKVTDAVPLIKKLVDSPGDRLRLQSAAGKLAVEESLQRIITEVGKAARDRIPGLELAIAI